MALNACHAMVQFNCRPIPWEEKLEMAKRHPNVDMENLAITEAAAGNPNFGPVPQYYLDCQMYQRSADVFLGVPLNIASYALLTNIIAKMCNMIPGDYIHTFGDVHLYDNHIQQINLQLSREPFDLPTLKLKNDIDWLNLTIDDVVAIAKSATLTDFASLENYKHHDKIIGELSTGLVSK
jgi:thymidylate synthase